MVKSLKIIIILICWVACGLFIRAMLNGSFTLTAESHARKAQQLSAKGLDTEALDKLAEAAALHPDNANIRLQSAAIHMQRRDFEPALEHYRAALEINPLLFLSGTFRGFIADVARQDQHRGFLDDLRNSATSETEAAALDISARVAHYRLMRAAQHISLRATIIAGEVADMIFLEIGRGSFEKVRLALLDNNAEEEFNEGLQAAVDTAELHCNDMLKFFGESVSADGALISSRMSLAMLHRQPHSLLEIIVELDINAPDFDLFRARLYAETGRLEEAGHIARQVLEREPRNIAARQLLALLAFNRRDFDALRPLLAQFLKANSRDSLALFMQGGIDFIDGDYSTALQRIATAASGSNRNLQRYYLALAEMRVGKHINAESTLREMTYKHPGSAELHLARALNALEAGDIHTAEQACRSILKFDQDNPDALRLLAAAQIARGDAEGTAETLRRYLGIRPDSQTALQALAAAELAINGAENFCKCFLDEFGYSAEDGPMSDAAHRVLALADLLQGKFGNATRHYEALQENDTSSPEASLLRARRHALEGRIHSAIEECRKALARGADTSLVMCVMGSLSSIAGMHYDARNQLSAAAEWPASRGFIIDVYISLTRHQPDAQAARNILLLDPFTKRSQDLLVSLYGAGFAQLAAEGELEAALERLPRLRQTLNTSVVLRRADAVERSRGILTEMKTTWPRLLEYARLPVMNYDF